MLKPISEIKANLGLEPNGRVQKYFTATCARYMDKYVPADEYNLRRTVIENGVPTENVKIDTITYTQPYAHAQYVGIVNGGKVKNYTTPRNGTLLG